MLKPQNLLLIITTLIIIFLNLGEVGKSSVKAETPIALQQADALTETGQQLIERGQPREALSNWEEATKIYRRINYQEGVTGSLINQSLALRDLGLNLRACSTLLESLKWEMEWLCNSTLTPTPNQPLETLIAASNKLQLTAINALGLQNLGDILRLIGKIKESKIVLEKALTIANSKAPAEAPSILLALGNSERSQFMQLKDEYLNITAPDQQANITNLLQQQVVSAANFYQRASSKNALPTLQLKAQLNWLSLLIDAEHLPQLHNNMQPRIASLIQLIQQNSAAFAQLPSNQSALVHLNFASSLLQLPGDDLHVLARQNAESALRIAKSLGDVRLESSSFGILGRLEAQVNQSQADFEEALRLAQSIQAWDLAWQWQQELGKLYQKQGDYGQAVAAYSGAIENLNRVRANLLPITGDVQFSFRNEVEPIYRQLVDLLLHPQAQNNSQPLQSNLVQARSTIESLQLAELDNFFRIACLQGQPVLLDRVVDRDDPSSAVIYPIILADRLAVILKLPSQPLHYYETTIAQSQVEELLAELRQKLTKTYTLRDVQSLSQQVYNWLIRPAEQDLAKSRIKTLVFVLDGTLRNIPMTALYDGQQYLVQKYAVALSPGLQLLPPKSIKQGHLKVLTAGLTEAHQGFSALTNVELELEQIKARVASTELLNQRFTTAKLEKEINSVSFPVVHLATHGQFSSQAERTFILAWDKPILVNDLNSFLQARDQSNPIDLLVLSACETATGDKRATLGLAGVAIRAGARSTLASLWLLDDESSALMMGQFYQGLAKELTKADAIRYAQLALLQNPQFAHPNYWANFVLVGSWL